MKKKKKRKGKRKGGKKGRKRKKKRKKRKKKREKRKKKRGKVKEKKVYLYEMTLKKGRLSSPFFTYGLKDREEKSRNTFKCPPPSILNFKKWGIRI